MSAETLVAPAYLSVPDHAVTSAGGEASDLAAMAGLELDGEQRIALDAILSEGPDELWASIDSAIVCPRQNGKTVVLQAIALADLFLFDAELVMWSAHLFPTAQDAFRDLEGLIVDTPEFSRRLKRIDRADGQEGFELHGGQRLKFKARSKTGGRGLTGDRVILDEAFAIGAAEIGSLYPTLSARPNPSAVYASSAGMIGSAHLRMLRDRGRKGGDGSLVWVEWCAEEGDCARPHCDHRPGAEGCLLDDQERWRAANFSLGRRRANGTGITLRYLESERKTLPVEEFMRERLGWWDEPAFGGGSIPADAWVACRRRTADIEEPCTLAVDVAPGSVAGSIVVCGGALHVSAHQSGTGWIVEKLVELVAAHEVLAVGLDPTGPASALIPDLERAGFVIRDKKNGGTLVLLDGRESTQACEQFLRDVVGHTLVHRDELALNTAVENAGRRQVGDSWKWSRRDSAADISPLVAATVARYLYMQYRPEPGEADFFTI